jgi:Zn-dependent peptidase ImmA (M78 family)
MQAKGYINATKDATELVARLLSFFGVSSVSAWDEYWSGRVTAARFKRARAHATNNYAVAAWLRRGDVEACEIDCNPYDEARLRDALAAIRRLTRSAWPDFRNELVETLASSGVSIAFVPDLSGLKLRGAAYWATKDRAVIIVSDHMKLQSRFWFALFHEAMHILLHSKKALFIDYDVKSDEELSEEKEADQGAANFLIPAERIREFVVRQGRYAANHKASTISSFAREIGIGPDLLLARLQRDDIIPWNSRLNKEFCVKVHFSDT